MPARIQPAASVGCISVPVHDAQPISGGSAPTTAPTHVFAMLCRFIGVYTNAYSATLSAPSAAVSGFVSAPSTATPPAAEHVARLKACAGAIARRGSGRARVRAICASYGASTT